MSSVGLVYVGAVLFVNGVMLLGWLTPRAVAPLNLFVGALQVVTPTYLIIAADGEPAAILAASGIYLFGFTYLWVGTNAVKDYDNRGLGWFSLFVALCAVFFALHNFTALGDTGFGVIWSLWAVLWFLFFLVLGLELDTLTAATGLFTVVVAFITAVAAFQLLLGNWTGSATEAIVLAVIGAGTLLIARPVATRLAPRRGEVIAARTQHAHDRPPSSRDLENPQQPEGV